MTTNIPVKKRAHRSNKPTPGQIRELENRKIVEDLLKNDEGTKKYDNYTLSVGSIRHLPGFEPKGPEGLNPIGYERNLYKELRVGSKRHPPGFEPK